MHKGITMSYITTFDVTFTISAIYFVLSVLANAFIGPKVLTKIFAMNASEKRKIQMLALYYVPQLILSFAVTGYCFYLSVEGTTTVMFWGGLAYLAIYLAVAGYNKYSYIRSTRDNSEEEIMDAIVRPIGMNNADEEIVDAIVRPIVR